VAWWLLYWTTEEAYKQQMIELSEQKRFDLNGFDLAVLAVDW